MDTGITIKPNPSVAASGYAPPTAASSQPTQTELPAAKTVTPPAETTTLRNDAPANIHEVIIDPQSREVIYRVLDARTRQVVRQVPDEALLRMRAYARALANGDSTAKAEYQADFEA